MRISILFYRYSFVFFCAVLSCTKAPFEDSINIIYPYPYPAEIYTTTKFIYTPGLVTVWEDLPDTLAKLTDDFVGFQNGWGGTHSRDSIYLTKNDLIGTLPQFNLVGDYILQFSKSNFAGYTYILEIQVTVIGSNLNPGPTDLEGNYKRTSNGHIIPIQKIYDGVYLIENLGGNAAVPAYPYLLYNYKSSTMVDSIVFPIQFNECGGGTQLVGPAATPGYPALFYANALPPIIEINTTAPVVFKWKIYSYETVNLNAIAPTSAICTWGNAATRVFEKQ